MNRILYVVSTLERTGPVNQLFNLIANLDRKLFYPYILTLSPEKKNSKKKDFIQLDIKIDSLNSSRFSTVSQLKLGIIAKINEIKPHIIHSQGIRPDIAAAKIEGNIPLISTIRNNPKLDYLNRYGKILGAWMARRHLKTIKQIENPIACSKSLAEQLSMLAGKNIAYIQNAVNEKCFIKADHKKKAALRNKYKIESTKKVFAVIGPLDAGKNVDTIVKMFSKQLEPDIADLLIIGDGKQKEDLLKAVSGFSNIKILGKQKNVVDYFQCADYFISASRFEGLPNAVLEAMACGLPVILSAIEAHKEIFDTLPSYPYFFNLDSPEKLGELMNEIIHADYKTLSRQMRSIIEIRFSASINAENYMRLYTRILEKI
jgi:glycosyltransferase involved in cell wall biosynthesis